MSRKAPLKLKNPYQHNSSPIIEQQNEEHSFLLEEQENHNQDAIFQSHPNGAHDQHLFNAQVEQICQIEELSEVYSHTNSLPYSVFPVELSGVHEKYLNEESWSLTKKSFRTEVKRKNPKKTQASIKFSKNRVQKPEEFNLNIDPLASGLSSLQIDRQSLLKSLTCKSSFSQEEKTDIFSQLGLKQPKTLGKARSKRDWQGVLTFLSHGELPVQFVNDFLQLLSKCVLVYQFFKNLFQYNYRNINMNQSSKISFKGTTFKYPVLKPNYKILSFNRSLKTPRRGSAYELALSQDFGLRKYQLQVGSLEHALREAQWRYDCQQPVLKCLYVELLSPGCSKSIKIDLYIEHMEMNLYDFSHLLLQEAMYLIVESLKGYKALFQRYGRVTVAHECIGICSSGNIAVWMNRFHEKDTAEARGKTSPLQIIEEIVKLVKGRCQPVCQKFLGKIQSYILNNKPSWVQLLHFFKRFILKNQIKVPGNLKYLLNQHRIKENVSSIRSSLNEDFELPEVNGEISIVIKSPRFHNFVPSQIRTRKNSNNIQTPKATKKLRKYSAVESNFLQLHRMENLVDRVQSSVSLKPKISPQKYSCCLESEDRSEVVKTMRKFDVSKDKSQISAKVGHLRAKSQSIDNLNTMSFLSPFDEYKSKSRLQKASGITQITRSGNSRAKSNQNQDKQNISFQAQTVKKIRNKESIRLDSLPFKEIQQEEVVPFYEIEGLQTPLVLSPQQSLQPTFKCIPEKMGEDTIKQQIYSMNNWTKTFKDLMTSSGDINVSITDGKEVSTYLSDVKLTHLDRISHQMVESLIHDGSESEIEELRHTTQ